MADQFVDVYLPPCIPGYPCVVSPVTSTTISAASSGDEGRNRNWLHPLRKVKLPSAEARTWDQIEGLQEHFLVLGGPFNSWAFRDPYDFATVSLEAPNERDTFVLGRVTLGDQAFGTGDGTTRTFPLTKTYTRGGLTYVRPIELPLLDLNGKSTVLIGDNGSLVSPSGYSISRPGGVVTFTSAPAAGHALTWGGLFDIAVRFEADDSLSAILTAYQVSGFADITLQESRVC